MVWNITRIALSATQRRQLLHVDAGQAPWPWSSPAQIHALLGVPAVLPRCLKEPVGDDLDVDLRRLPQGSLQAVVAIAFGGHGPELAG